MELAFIFTILIWLYFSIFCHEMGHFMTAKILRFNPYLVRIGVGRTILNYKILNTLIEIKAIPTGGFTNISNIAQQGLKSKLILIHISGPLSNLFLGLLLYFISNNLEFIEIISNLSSIEFLIFITNLIPLKTYQDGRTYSSDGKQILDTLIKSKQKIIQKLLGLSRYTLDKNNTSLIYFNNDIELLYAAFQVEALLQQKKYDNAIEILEQILNHPNCLTRDKVYIIDVLASIVINYGEIKYLQKADNWSLQALEIASNLKTVQGTRGAILIEMGKYYEGKEILLPLTEVGNDGVDIAVSCCYIAKADYFLGNEEQVNYWLKKAGKIGMANHILLRIKREINR
ncbi:hypothetical protein WA1_21375 [Scytonema hofmannii PCC 7110]|uniref:Peptidase M50 domain-containing protein n=1 Tax=Scytonema hofmannii PCC 7110 TaxID=128403 RepID=A0A139XD33_9CYAN|nr:hypothetical protein WA1_21375 [Scytonema hofmannii PCC 7110]